MFVLQVSYHHGLLASFLLTLLRYLIRFLLIIYRWQTQSLQRVDILIGGVIYTHILLEGVRKNILESLIIQETVFG